MTDQTILGKNGDFIIGLTAERMAEILKNKMRTISLTVPQEAMDQLSEANKRALYHLIKAGEYIDRAFLKQDHPDNIEAEQLLQDATASGNKLAADAYTIFRLQHGVEGKERYNETKDGKLRVFADKAQVPGKNFFNRLSKDTVVNYIVEHPERASAILGNNTIVRPEGDKLMSEPYSVAFDDEMAGAAKELQLAADETDHPGFAAYLNMQAQALTNDSDAEFTYNADMKWQDLESFPLEFTIERENYEDDLSKDVAVVPAVHKILTARQINAKAKDSLGVRVGIIDRAAAAEIADYRAHMDGISQIMPLREQYNQASRNITFADVWLVSLSGNYKAAREGITQAQNLPNDDKLAKIINQIAKLVFHKQVRENPDPAKAEFYKEIIDPAQLHLLDGNTNFIFTVGHELGHSLGPSKTLDGRDKNTALGNQGNTIEESKADLISVIATEHFVEIGKFTREQAEKLYLTWMVSCLLPQKPSEEQAHRVRSVMQANYFLEKGALKLEVGGKMSIVPERIAEVARQMLTEEIQLQLDGDAEKSDAFVKKYFDWNAVMQYQSAEQMKHHPRTYLLIEQPVRDQILRDYAPAGP